MSVLRLRGVRKSFPGGVEAVAGIDLDVTSGEFLVVVGPSGSGKSTLLRLVAGLERPTSGEVWLGEDRVDAWPPQARDVAMVFQDSSLFPHLSVFENLAFGPRARGARRAAVVSQVAEAARLMGLEGLLDRRPAQLSGGQRRRVALGRALVRRPRLFLLDEPLSNLDGPLRLSLREELAALHRRLGATIVMVTHDQTEALALGDRVAVMRAGRVVQVGPPRDVYERPVDQFVAASLSALPMAFVPARVATQEGECLIELEGAPGPTPIESAPVRDGLVLLGLRPDAVSLAACGEGWIGKVSHVAWLGREGLVTVRVGDLELHGLTGPEARWGAGDRAVVHVDCRRALWFDPVSGVALGDGP